MKENNVVTNQSDVIIWIVESSVIGWTIIHCCWLVEARSLNILKKQLTKSQFWDSFLWKMCAEGYITNSITKEAVVNWHFWTSSLLSTLGNGCGKIQHYIVSSVFFVVRRFVHEFVYGNTAIPKCNIASALRHSGFLYNIWRYNYISAIFQHVYFPSRSRVHTGKEVSTCHYCDNNLFRFMPRSTHMGNDTSMGWSLCVHLATWICSVVCFSTDCRRILLLLLQTNSTTPERSQILWRFWMDSKRIWKTTVNTDNIQFLSEMLYKMRRLNRFEGQSIQQENYRTLPYLANLKIAVFISTNITWAYKATSTSSYMPLLCNAISADKNTVKKLDSIAVMAEFYDVHMLQINERHKLATLLCCIFTIVASIWLKNMLYISYVLQF